MSPLIAMAVQMIQQAQAAAQAQAQQEGAPAPGAHIAVRGVSFHPPGAERPLLRDVTFDLRPNQLGLVLGRSGSGKTTLLQLLAGLTDQTSGQVYIWRAGAGGAAAAAGASGGSNSSSSNGGGPAPPLDAPAAAIEDRMRQVGLVFQFPERHFIGGDLLSELTFGWPRGTGPEAWAERAALSARLDGVARAVGLDSVPLQRAPTALSGGQQRKVALAIQLARRPALLLLDEPLAGLDWKARQEVVALLRQLKKECTLLVVSHDLREVAPLVDVAWRMRPGGRLEAVAWPPPEAAMAAGEGGGAALQAWEEAQLGLSGGSGSTSGGGSGSSSGGEEE
jgi:energy-coupling factor transporter ATP-binding protein EcfA2